MRLGVSWEYSIAEMDVVLYVRVWFLCSLERGGPSGQNGVPWRRLINVLRPTVPIGACHDDTVMAVL